MVSKYKSEWITCCMQNMICWGVTGICTFFNVRLNWTRLFRGDVNDANFWLCSILSQFYNVTECCITKNNLCGWEHSLFPHKVTADYNRNINEGEHLRITTHLFLKSFFFSFLQINVICQRGAGGVNPIRIWSYWWTPPYLLWCICFSSCSTYSRPRVCLVITKPVMRKIPY